MDLSLLFAGPAGSVPTARRGLPALLQSAFVTPVKTGEAEALEQIPTARWRSLCGRRLDWVEVVPGGRSPSARPAPRQTTRR